MNKVIITGATSMLGLALLTECLQNKTAVIALIREDSKKKSLLPQSDLLSVIECDISNLNRLEADNMQNADAFYHFAWEATENKIRNNVDAQYRNVGYTLDAVRLAHRLGCKKFIGAGSQAEYGRVNGIINPDMQVAPDSAYGVSKYAAGKLSSLLCEQINLDFIWTRIFSVYGINDMPSTMIMYCIDTLLKGEIPALTKCGQQWDYLNCKDAAKAFYLLGKKGETQTIYNIGSGVAQELIEYVKTIRDTINPDLPLGIGEREYAPKQVMSLCADIANLKNDTGFEQTILFKDGIKETVEWVRGSLK